MNKKLLSNGLTIIGLLGYAAAVASLFVIMWFVQTAKGEVTDPESLGMGLIITTVVYGPAIAILMILDLITSTISFKAGRRLAKSNGLPPVVRLREKISALICLVIVLTAGYYFLPLTTYLLGIKYI